MTVLSFDTAPSAQAHVAGTIATALEQDIAARGRALLVLTGGSTVCPFLTALAAMPIDWSHVTVTLSDERWVETDSPHSNEAQLRALFFNRLSTKPNFIGLKTFDATPQAGLAAVTAHLFPHLPVSAALLSIGEDGHVASLFPSEPSLWQDSKATLIATSARSGRLSLSANVLREARVTLALLGAGRELDTEKNNYLNLVFKKDVDIVAL